MDAPNKEFALAGSLEELKATGVKKPAKAADSTSARTSVEWINAIPPRRETVPDISLPVAGGLRKATASIHPEHQQGCAVPASMACSREADASCWIFCPSLAPWFTTGFRA
jgi:hypothetical protein